MHSTVQGVPIAGPNVGTTFPPEDYVALPIGNHQLYITWLDPTTFAIVDGQHTDAGAAVILAIHPGNRMEVRDLPQEHYGKEHPGSGTKRSACRCPPDQGWRRA